MESGQLRPEPIPPGAQAWYDAQLDLFASWGLDFLKVDDMQTPVHSDEIATYHRAIAKAEAKYGRSIDLSLSPGGWVATSYVDFLRENAQMWRISDDLWDRWEDIYQQFARLARWAPFQTTGHWADADMVPFGHIGLRAERGDDRQSRLTLDEQKTLLALWCMGRSPLMVGGDLPTSNSDAIALLQNSALREVLAGSTNNRETIRKRIFGKWWDESAYHGSRRLLSRPTQPIGPMAHVPRITAAITPRCSGPAATHTRSAATSSYQSIVGLDARNDDWTLADLYADAPGEPADVRLEGVGADRVITGTIPPQQRLGGPGPTLKPNLPPPTNLLNRPPESYGETCHECEHRKRTIPGSCSARKLVPGAFAGVLTCSLSVSVCSLLRLACVLYVLSVS